MVCFGGAGPLHASALMEELGIPTVMIPYAATAHSAYGFVCSDICHHLAASWYFRNPDVPAAGSTIISDGDGFISSTIILMIWRGVRN